ncbi:hypothetical protein ACIGW8_38080 [Streptomyces sioyaensis]
MTEIEVIWTPDKTLTPEERRKLLSLLFKPPVNKENGMPWSEHNVNSRG